MLVSLRNLACILLISGCSAQAPGAEPLVLSAGDNRLVLAADRATIRLERGGGALLRVAASDFELGVVDALDDDASYDPFWLIRTDHVLAQAPPADLRWRAASAFEVVSHSDIELVLDLPIGASLSARLTLEAVEDDRFVAQLAPASTGPAVALIRIGAGVDMDEGFYGLGEWPDTPSHRGKLRPMQIELEPGIESGNNENHVPIPLLIGTTGWGLFFESRQVGLFEVATEAADKVAVTYADVLQEGLRFHLFAASHPLDLTRRYYDVTGAPKLPAPWALGPLIWRDENRNQAEVEQDIDMIRDLDLATSGIWIDRPYATAVNTFDFKAADYPDPAAMIAKAHDEGMRVAVWHTPYLADDAEPLKSEAEQQGYFPPKTGLLLNRWSEPIDFTNPAAMSWWQGLIRRYRAIGIEGFKLDYGEDLAPGVGGARSIWSFDDGSDERTMHYGYTKLYHQAYAETLPVDGGFLLCRAARWGEQTAGLVIWPGDLDATLTAHRERFETRGGDTVAGVGGLAAAVSMGLSVGVSGFPFYGSDTGGYRHSPPNEETFIRWFQQTAASTVMQVGDSSSQPPWVFTTENGRSDATVALYRQYARLHLRLFPYLWTYATQLAVDGRAIQRPFGLVFPEFGEHPPDVYMLGDHLLVAPVVTAGTRERVLRLPPGPWVHWFRGDVFEGGQIATVPAPLEELPLLLAAGGIVPLLRETIDTIAPTAFPQRVQSFATEAGPLHVAVFGGPESSFRVYDGTLIRQRADGATITIDVERGAVFGDAPIVVEVLGLNAEPTVGGDVAGLEWRTDRGGLALVTIPVAGKQVVITKR